MRKAFLLFWIAATAISSLALAEQERTAPKVRVGIDQILDPPYLSLLKGKRVGLIVNPTSVTSQGVSTIAFFKEKSKSLGFTVTALFAPEHGLQGNVYAGETVKNQTDPDGLPIYSLYGDTRRPTKAMLDDVDVFVYDIQDIGTRSYTFASTLFYVMEEASKRHIPVIVADRPNPINGWTVDGPMLETKFRSFVGYVNVPYCHGMTLGELARFFNEEYQVKCQLTVVPMKGWRRDMSFKETGLLWIPPSPNIPEPDSPLFYPTTGILGELPLVSVGIGYTLPFKVLGAPWIDAERLAQSLNKQLLPGVRFMPYYFRPFSGRYANENCQGVFLVVTDARVFKPVSTFYLLISALRTLYPDKVDTALTSLKEHKDMFCKVTGTDKILELLLTQKFTLWKLREIHQQERTAFLEKRQKYLIADYAVPKEEVKQMVVGPTSKKGRLK